MAEARNPFTNRVEQGRITVCRRGNFAAFSNSVIQEHINTGLHAATIACVRDYARTLADKPDG